MILKEFSDGVRGILDSEYPNQTLEHSVRLFADCVSHLGDAVTQNDLGLVADSVGAVTFALSNFCDKIGINYPEAMDTYWINVQERAEKQKYADSMAANA